MRELRVRVTDLENKLRVKEQELKSNEIELVARTEKYEQHYAKTNTPHHYLPHRAWAIPDVEESSSYHVT